ncbi:MAG: Gfo/Idh/MocA family oxidoreductase [Tabrizicola sp.]|uniref:Gfo/Idh/MocA family oxidoreductase n=1 Tax=Tabrizicola sp. TaxID=2005166 RepID=UPI0027352649|nr:Gfo/Idh/MocA family oxidoreductase [Tabrizicola sp.]MDP3262104.1 Gfo/Idh/MocA family oxidoreductase [Tabrizicola sp.]MDP3648150.1 Gfo/Idh/MocA family oxidoreductase [Paracoccaceae bacterium]MDZ4069689.1 Gfo/Idh/MocA family oxidoreductase [Tabrizicola sp.]
MTVAVGVIGLGVMGAEHLRLLREETGGAQVVAVCDADADRAQALAAGAQVFSDPMALIAAPGVEAVVIASPDATHAGLALACIAQRKPALCEKPLAATAAEALRIVDAEVARGRRLLQIGYMRRFDPAYVEMRAVLLAGGIGAPVLLHNIHRNAAAPNWFTGPMAVTNSFVHEIDISRWLLGSDLATASVNAAPGGDPLMITLETDTGQIVSTEVFMNAAYGYHVHAQLVGREGTVEMAAPSVTLTNRGRQHGHGFPANWVPRFADAYRIQMRAWVQSVASGVPVGASAWDGFVATAVAEQVVTALQTGSKVSLCLATRPGLYT